MATIRSLRIMMYVDHSKVKSGLKKTEDLVRKSASNMVAAISSVLLKIGLAKTIGSVLRKGVERAMKFQRYRIELGAMSGIGGQLMKELKDLAMRSPFPIDEWVGGSKRLLSSGVAGERVTEIMEMLGNMAAATGSTVRDLALIFGQVFAKGRLQGEEVLQFMERGISLNKALQKTLGKSASELQKMQEKGLITPDMMTDAMRFMTSPEGIFGGMMDAVLNTVEGQLVALKNIIDVTMADFGTMLLPVLSVLLKGFASLAKTGSFISGYMEAIAFWANAFLAVIALVVNLVGFLSDLTYGVVGYVLGAALAWLTVAGLVKLVVWGVTALNALTGAWAIVSGVCLKIWAWITGMITTATGGLNLLLAALTALVVVAGGGWIIKWGIDKAAEQFDRMMEKSGVIKENMKAVSQTQGKGALFQSREAYDIISKSRADIQQRMLDELKRIRMAEEKEEFDREQARRRAQIPGVFGPAQPNRRPSQIVHPRFG